MMKKKRTNEIRKFILDAIARSAPNVANLVAKEFGMSRQAVNRHLTSMLNEGILIAKGATRNREYSLKPFVSQRFEFDLPDEQLKDVMHGSHDEDRAWSRILRPLFNDLSENVLRICQYGFTEMLNNVFDHSEATKAIIEVEHNAARIDLTIIDNGVGIFNKIKHDFGLEDHLQAILELAKGKLTTDPQRHTGEGIFFASRMFDHFYIESGTLRFVHFKEGEDWLVEKPDKERSGTAVFMTISPNSRRTIKEVFNEFSTELDEYGFTKTKVPVALARYGDENLISRSQAKRLLARFERFKEVILDFSNVESIGPAFADEIFRVFTQQHPNIVLRHTNASEEVRKMIVRAQRPQ